MTSNGEVRMVPQGEEPVNEEWHRTRRSLQSAISGLASSRSEEECQAIGLLCRETLISVAQAVTDFTVTSSGTAQPSPTDAKRLLDAFIGRQAQGPSRDEERSFARSCIALASKLVHQRTATIREATLCCHATEATVRIIALMAGVEIAGQIVQVGFPGPTLPRLLKVHAVRCDDLPSVRYRKRVESVLAKRRAGVPDEPLIHLVASMGMVLGQGRPLESLSTKELQEKLNSLSDDTWKERDAYERLEKTSHRLNLSLYNAGQQYLDLEQARIHTKS